LQTKKKSKNLIVLDIRTAQEFSVEYIPNSILIDFYNNNFSKNLDKLDKSKTYLLYCRSGNRSGRAKAIMRKLGFQKVLNIVGGIRLWKYKGFPVVKNK